MPINVFRQSRCLNTSDSICDLFKWVCDRNDRNDKENGKSHVRANGRGLQISCHSCHLCHGPYRRGNFLPRPIVVLASDANGQSLPISSITITHLLVALISKCLAKLHFGSWLLSG